MTQHRALAPRMVGRSAQLQDLGEHLRQVRAGAGRLVLIAGEAGAGKSRLVRAFLERVAATGGAEVLLGRCAEEQPAPPYGPFVDALRSYARLRGADALVTAAGPLAGDLLPLLPELGCPAPAPPACDAQSQKQRLFEALYRALRPRGTGRARILVLEDLHWSARTAQDVLRHLARASARDPLLILGTYRSDELPRRHPLARTLVQLTRDRLLYEVDIPPLSRSELAQMLDATLEGRPPGAFVDALHDASGGNPFFVEEILRTLLDQGRLEPLLQAARAGRAGSPLAAIPRSVKESIRARTADLDAQTTEVLTYAAVIGRRFAFDLLLTLTGLDEAAVLRAVRELIDRQIVAEERDAPEESLSFRHALSREAVYDDLLARDRRGRHRAVLRALEELHPDHGEAPVEQLTYHSLRAGDRAQAARYAQLAGDRSMRTYAYREAVGHYEAALASLQPGDAGRMGALEALAAAAFPLGEAALYERCWREALAHYERVGDSRKVAKLHNDLAHCAKDREDHAEALAHLEAARTLLEAAPPGVELGRAYEAITNTYCNMGRSHQCLAWAEKTERLGALLGDEEVQISAMHLRGRAVRDLGDPRAGVAHLERCLERDREGGFIQSMLSDCLHLGWTWRMLGEYRRAIAVLDEGFAQADRHGWRLRMDGDCGGHLGAALLELGQWQRAQEALERSLDAAAQGHPWARRAAGPWRAELWLRQGRPHDAQRLLEQILPEAVPAGLLQELWPIAARVRLALDDRAGALAALAHVAQDWRARGSPAGQERLLAWALEIYLALGHPDDAADLLRDLSTLGRRSGAPAAEASCAESEGLMAAHRGSHAEAAAYFARAIAIWQRQEAGYLEAHACRLRAASLLAIGDPACRAEGERELAVAQAIFAQLGAPLDLETCAATARRRGIAQASRPAVGHDGLTRREREVLALLARGHSNRAIADTLVISERTAEHHVANILGKLGCTSRAQAAAYAVEHGLAGAPV